MTKSKFMVYGLWFILPEAGAPEQLKLDKLDGGGGGGDGGGDGGGAAPAGRVR